MLIRPAELVRGGTTTHCTPATDIQTHRCTSSTASFNQQEPIAQKAKTRPQCHKTPAGRVGNSTKISTNQHNELSGASPYASHWKTTYHKMYKWHLPCTHRRHQHHHRPYNSRRTIWGFIVALPNRLEWVESRPHTGQLPIQLVCLNPWASLCRWKAASGRPPTSNAPLTMYLLTASAYAAGFDSYSTEG